MIDALADEGFDGRNGHFCLAGCLGAGAVAVDAFQVATVCNIDFDIVPAGLKRFAEWAADPGLTTDELEGIQQQSFQCDVSVPARQFQRRRSLGFAQK